MDDKTLESLNIKKLDDKIWIFNKWVKNPQEYIDYYLTDPEQISRWVSWYIFGEMIGDSGLSWGTTTEFPTKEAWTKEFSGEPDPYKRKIADLFYDASSIFINETKTYLPSWKAPTWGIARYFPDVPEFNEADSDGRTMRHHTDYQQEIAEYPGEKFGITAVVYLNDDYEGGDINFRITDPEDNKKVVKEIFYKPEAGDILMFPSTPPYYHGVMNVKKASKYMIRLYWIFEEEASEDYKRLKEKYGPAFEELEKVRRKRRDLAIQDPVLHQRMTIGEYYRLLESGELKDSYLE